METLIFGILMGFLGVLIAGAVALCPTFSRGRKGCWTVFLCLSLIILYSRVSGHITDSVIRFINKCLPSFPIDIVYTWVNGSDPVFQQNMKRWLNNSSLKMGDSGNKARFIDHDELKYSLRSISENAPWINRVYIVTNGQTPSWLNLHQNKIHLIRHDEIILQEALPTFNSDAIEANLHRIPGLREHFLFSNDDFFIHRPVTPLFFFTLTGKPKFRTGMENIRAINWNRNRYTKSIMLASLLFENKYGTSLVFEPAHTTIPYLKSDYNSCVTIFNDWFNISTFSKFRSDGCPHRSIIAYYSLHLHHAMRISKARSNALYVALQPQQEIRRKIDREHPTLLCINDVPSSKDSDRDELKTLLSDLYPVKSEYEV